MSRRVGGSKTGRESLNYGYQLVSQDKFQSSCEFRSESLKGPDLSMSIKGTAFLFLFYSLSTQKGSRTQ
jgi:hypothetical protein